MDQPHSIITVAERKSGQHLGAEGHRSTQAVAASRVTQPSVVVPSTRSIAFEAIALRR